MRTFLYSLSGCLFMLGAAMAVIDPDRYGSAVSALGIATIVAFVLARLQPRQLTR